MTDTADTFLQKPIERETTMSRIQDIRNAIKERSDFLAHVGGCSDGNCVIRRPEGMHTNGGCSCSNNGQKMQKYCYANNLFAAMIKTLVAASSMLPLSRRMRKVD